jgi:hypothetical protein
MRATIVSPLRRAHLRFEGSGTVLPPELTPNASANTDRLMAGYRHRPMRTGAWR